MKEKPEKIEPGQIWELKGDNGSTHFKIVSPMDYGGMLAWNHICVKESQHFKLGHEGWDFENTYLNYDSYIFIGYADEKVKAVSEEKLCSCSIQQLMVTGCRCGGK